MSNQIMTGNKATGIVPVNFDDVQRIAKQIVSAGMGSFDWNDNETQKIAKASAQIMCGLELGVPPMQALSNIAIIKGRPLVYGDLVPALLYAAGMKFNMWNEGEGEDRIGVAEIERPDGTKRRATFSVAQAKQAGLWDTRARVQKKGKGGSFYEADNDSPWFRYSDDMLRWKAVARVVDIGAPDVLKGVNIREDMEYPSEPIDITPNKPEESAPEIEAELEGVFQDVTDAETLPTEGEEPNAGEKHSEDETAEEESETIADEEGLLGKIEEDLATTGNMPDLIDEVHDQYSELIERMSAAGQKEANELFEGARS